MIASRGARRARRDEGAYCWYATEEQRSQPGLKNHPHLEPGRQVEHR